MKTQEKLMLFEEILRVMPNTLTEDTELSTVQEWDSLTILSFQVRLSAINPDLQFGDLFNCHTVGDICRLI